MSTISIDFNKYELKFMGDIINAVRLCHAYSANWEIKRNEDVARACELILEKVENAERQLKEVGDNESN